MVLVSTFLQKPTHSMHHSHFTQECVLHYDTHMLTIFCGDDTATSRAAFLRAKEAVLQQHGSPHEVESSEILDIVSSGGSDAWDLFTGKPTYFTTNLVKVLKRKLSRAAKAKLRELSADPSIQIVDWEDVSAYDLGFDKKDNFSFVRESPVSVSTFTLLPCVRPGSKREFVQILTALKRHQPIEVTYSMIMRHIKLMLALSQHKTPRENPYMVRLAATCLSQWSDTRSLLELYKRLLKTEINMKTGRNTPLSMTEQIEMIAAFLM